jgi:hypothetical protein
VTYPFQSIVSTPHKVTDNPLGPEGECDQRDSFAEALAEDLRAEELPAISVEPPFGISELFAGIETGLCAPREAKKVTGVPALPPQQRGPLRGGVYTPEVALKLINSHFFIGKNNQETGIFRINNDGSVTFMPSEQFKLDVANILVRTSGGSAKPIPVEKFWKENSERHERKIVFKPGGTAERHEFNLWQDDEHRRGAVGLVLSSRR